MADGPGAAPGFSDRRRQATLLSLVAALLWSSYYLFVLALEGSVALSALVAYPFLAGGVAYAVWAGYRGEAVSFAAGFGRSGSYLRIALFLSTQVLLLIVTLSGGPVDAALLSLVGDVVLTPLFARALVGEGRGLLRNPLFLGGMVLATAGALLTILEGGSAHALNPLATFAGVLLPVVLAVFFVSAAEENLHQPISTVAGGASLGAGIGAILIAPLLPGGWPGLVVGPYAFALLVFAGVVTFFVGPELYFRAIRRAGLLLPALLMTAIPVFTLGFTVAVTRAAPSPLGLAGIPIAALGGLIAVRSTQAPGPLSDAALEAPLLGP
ncbi:MAG: DMT family transporter [Thermoplasmata archaeon]|nr:DMT family transporter [Thermoplasmata archaeon]